ncbi:MAG: hypothetical protein K9N55_16800 [Phycisphaerae bacterium]|nr:hypothetical protein [Phycisphaerae bacterium]
MKKTQKSNWKKWQRRLILAVCLLALMVLGLHSLLKSDLPRVGLLRILTTKFKLETSIKTLQVNWNGTTRIRNLQVIQSQYPLPLVTVEDLTMSHTALIRMLLTRQFNLNTLTVTGPHLNIQQAQSGVWNIQALAEAIPASTGSRHEGPSPLALPDITLDRVELTITDAIGTVVRFENSAFKGRARAPKTWTFSGNLGQGLQLEGDIALDPALSHSVRLKYTDLDSLVNSHVKADLNNFTLEGHWRGRMEASGLCGTLRLDRASADTFSSQGEVDIEANLQDVKASVKGLTCSLTADPNHPVTLESGQIRWQREENRLSMDKAFVTGFGGRLTVQATLPVANPLEMEAVLTLSDLDLARLPRLFPLIEGLHGKAFGTLKTHITLPEEKALEPLRITLALDLQEGRFKQAQIRSIQATGYVGPQRWLVDQSHIALLNGNLHFWIRSTQHADERLTYVNTDFNDIDLKQALQTLEVDTKKAVGKASGKGMMVTGSKSGMTGVLDITVKEADLLNTLVIGTLYNALSLNLLNSKAPTGQGRARLTLEQNTLRLTEFEYFNRGIEVRGTGSAQDISLGDMTPIQGTVMASSRPLKGLKLPGISDLDQLLTSLQKGTATVTIENTLKDPKVSVVPFAQVQGIMKQILWIQLKPSNKKR